MLAPQPGSYSSFCFEGPRRVPVVVEGARASTPHAVGYSAASLRVGLATPLLKPRPLQRMPPTGSLRPLNVVMFALRELPDPARISVSV